MVKSELVKVILKQYPEFTLDEIEKIINIFFDQLSQAMIANETAELRHFGTFYTRKRAARNGRNPRTKDIVNIEKKIIPFFRPSKNLIKSINLK